MQSGFCGPVSCPAVATDRHFVWPRQTTFMNVNICDAQVLVMQFDKNNSFGGIIHTAPGFYMAVETMHMKFAIVRYL